MSLVQARHITTSSAPAPSTRDETSILIIGIGNNLLGDDGAGVHVIENLRRHKLPPNAELIDGGTLSFALLEHVENADWLIVVDAAELNAEPGAVRVFHDREMDRFLSTSRRPTVHEVNLLDVLGAARLRGRMPSRCSLVGIQPLHVGWSAKPSGPVKAAVEQATQIIHRIICGQDA